MALGNWDLKTLIEFVAKFSTQWFLIGSSSLQSEVKLSSQYEISLCFLLSFISAKIWRPLPSSAIKKIKFHIKVCTEMICPKLGELSLNSSEIKVSSLHLDLSPSTSVKLRRRCHLNYEYPLQSVWMKERVSEMEEKQ